MGSGGNMERKLNFVNPNEQTLAEGKKMLNLSNAAVSEAPTQTEH